MYHIGRSLRALVRGAPRLPDLRGDAFVFGAAPDPAVPMDFLDQAAIITANASQIWLERLGIEKPRMTLMRANMSGSTPQDKIKVDALRGRRTGLLVLHASSRDARCLAQLEVLRQIGYRYDDLLILDRTDYLMIYNRLLDPRQRILLKNYQVTQGVRAILLALAMGADRVVAGGISLEKDGCSFSDLKYERVHVDGDRDVLSRIARMGRQVYSSEKALSYATGLPLWTGVSASA